MQQVAPHNGAAALNTTPWVWRSRMLASTCGVQVKESKDATTFSIDAAGNLVVPLQHCGGPDATALLMGGTLHEIAHLRWSDFSVLDHCSPIERTFLIVIEDGRIERLACDEWQGARSQLQEMWQLLYKKGSVTRYREGIDDPLYALGLWLLGEVRADTLQLQDSLDDARLAKARFCEMLSLDAAHFVERKLGEVEALASTAEVLRWVRQVLEPFVRPDQKQDRLDFQTGTDLPDQVDQASQPGPQQGGAGQGAKKAEPEPPPAVGSSDGEGAPQEANVETGQATSSNSPSPSGDQVQEGEGDDRAQGHCPEPPAIDVIDFEFPEVDAGDMASAMLVKIASSSAADNEQGGGAGGAQHSPNSPVPESVRTPGSDLISRVTFASMGLRARLQHLLRTVASTRRLNGTKGRLDASRAWRLKLLDLNVWKPATERIELDTYIHVLVDLSASMQGYQAQVAVDAATGVALACEGVNGVKVGIDRFPGTVDAPYLSTLKRPNQPVRAAAMDLASAQAYGGTPLLQALPLAVRTIRAQRASRHILMIPTDGLPPRSEVARCYQAIQAIRRAGIDVVTVGIGCSATAIDPHAVQISSVDQLSGVLFKALDTLMRGNLKRAA